MTIKCEERYQEALEYAQKTNDESLQNALDNLEKKEKFYKGEIILYKDFAPLSFLFDLIDEKGNRILNGGLIYHGNPDQSYSFQIEKSTGWQIHT